MGYIEEMFLIACMQHLYHTLDLGTAESLGEHLSVQYPDLSKNAAVACLRGKFASKESRSLLARAALDMLTGHHGEVRSYLDGLDKATQVYLRAVIAKVAGNRASQAPADTSSSADIPKPMWRFSDSIFRNWRELSQPAAGLVGGGIYQLFRRYKPTAWPGPKGSGNAYDWSLSRNHVVICELILIDPENLECILITSESNMYLVPTIAEARVRLRP
ncbi:MAG: hypothetical protein WB524_05750, partial [Acidobacteriaceae bacterium]